MIRLYTDYPQKTERSRAEAKSWEGVDGGLFETLRDLSRELATERGVPAYMIFGNATLRELAPLRPTNLEDLAGIRGVGEKRLQDVGGGFVAEIRSYCEERPSVGTV